MNQEIKQKWLDALRSNKYKKGVKKLHYVDNSRHHKYCCLGVLCNILDVPNERLGGTYYYRGTFTELPDDTKSLCAISSDQQTELMRMNDGSIDLKIKKHSFKEIADHIEKNF